MSRYCYGEDEEKERREKKKNKIERVYTHQRDEEHSVKERTSFGLVVEVEVEAEEEEKKRRFSPVEGEEEVGAHASHVPHFVLQQKRSDGKLPSWLSIIHCLRAKQEEKNRYKKKKHRERKIYTQGSTLTCT